jgi:hypothetical protein
MVGKRKYGSLWVGLLLLLTAFVGMQTSASAGGEPPVVVPGGPYQTYECNSLLFDASGSYDPEGAALQYRWNFNGGWTNWSLSPYEEYTWFDDFSGSVLLEVSDGDLVVEATIDVAVLNVAPFILSIDGPQGPIDAGTKMTLGVHYFDGDLREMITSLDACNAVVSWGDGTSTTYQGQVSDTMIAGSHVYATPGDYDIAVNLSDDDGGWSLTSLRVVVNASSNPPETPPEPSLQILVQTVLAMKLPKGLQNSLLAKLGIVDPAVDPKKIHVDINKLNAFINLVEAQRGKQLSKTQADALSRYAQAFIDYLKKM